MTPVMTPELADRRAAEYDARNRATALRRRLYAGGGLADDAAALAELDEAEERLAAAEAARRQEQEDDKSAGVVLDTRRDPGILGADTTGLEAEISMRLDFLPTSIAHLMTAEEQPLVTCRLRNATAETRRLRVTASIDGFSAAAVETAEIKGKASHDFHQLPALRPSAIREVNELTRASLNLLVEDIGAKTRAVELHRTVPVWLLPRSSAPLAVQDPVSGEWVDMAPYFAAFVTPNAPAVMAFLRKAAERHPDRRLVGYQGEKDGVEPQVQAIFEALKADGELTYVNSLLTSSPEEGFADQRVRLPRESLADKQANCIDGTVLYASLLEAASLHPAIVVVPGHAFVAWETWSGSGEWAFLETTETVSSTFAEARESAERTAERYRAQGDGPNGLRVLAVRELRAKRRITPME